MLPTLILFSLKNVISNGVFSFISLTGRTSAIRSGSSTEPWHGKAQSEPSWRSVIGSHIEKYDQPSSRKLGVFAINSAKMRQFSLEINNKKIKNFERKLSLLIKFQVMNLLIFPVTNLEVTKMSHSLCTQKKIKTICSQLFI